MKVDRARALALIEAFEGRIPHMYLDTVGVVTVGVGCALATADDAVALVWDNLSEGAEATPLEIAAEWGRVRAAVPGRRADTYRAITSLELRETEVERLFRWRLREKWNHLAEHFPALESYPEPAQLALLDLAFNLGASAIPRKFPRLTEAVRGQDWRTAALESHRPQARDRRNAAVRALFEDAARAGAIPEHVIT